MTVSPASPSRPSRRWWLIGAVAVAAVVVIVLVVSGGRQASTGGASPSGMSTPTASSTSAPPTTSAPTTDPTGDRPTSVPLPLDAVATPREGVEVQLTSIESVQGEGVPGETDGPAVRVGVTITNRTDADIDLTTTVVNLFYGDGVPADPLTGGQSSPFAASVAPGGAAGGFFVFTVPEDQRSAVSVEVDLSAQDSLIVFSGSVS